MSSLGDLRRQVIREGAVCFSFNGDISELAKNLGEIVPDPVTGRHVDIITNSKESRTNPSHLSFLMKSTELSFHSDYPDLIYPPRFILLRCVEEDLNIQTQYAHVNITNEGRLIELMAHEPWLIHRNGRWNAAKVLTHCGSYDWLVRFAANVMRPMFPGTSGLVQLANNAGALFNTVSFVLQKNDCLFLDNWRGFHRRTKVIGSPDVAPSRPRVLERVLLM